MVLGAALLHKPFLVNGLFGVVFGVMKFIHDHSLLDIFGVSVRVTGLSLAMREMFRLLGTGAMYSLDHAVGMRPHFQHVR